MTRSQHVEWCKNRALEYVDAGNLDDALASIGSDLNKHPETDGHVGFALGVTLRIKGELSTAEEMRKFINGFN